MMTELLNKLSENRRKVMSGITGIVNLIPQSELKRTNDAKNYWNLSESNVTLQDLSHWR